MKPRTRNILWIVGFLVVAGLAIGLGVGLTQGKNGSPQPSPKQFGSNNFGSNSVAQVQSRSRTPEELAYPHYCAVVKDQTQDSQHFFITCLASKKISLKSKFLYFA